jgi:hypothetical protein
MPRFRDLRVSRFCGLVLLAASATPAVAAPFCVRTQALPPQCIYVDAAQCQNEALRQGGVCTVNSAEVRVNPGIGQYCVVTSSVVSLCAYPDRGTCMAEAARHNGACVEAPGIAPGRAPDPYAAVGGR